MNFKIKNYTYIASGTNRSAYLADDKSHVIKVPLSDDPKDISSCVLANTYDLIEQKFSSSDIPMAECDWLGEGKVILRMEYIEPDTKLIEQGIQAGYDKNGNLKRFDP